MSAAARPSPTRSDSTRSGSTPSGRSTARGEETRPGAADVATASPHRHAGGSPTPSCSSLGVPSRDGEGSEPTGAPPGGRCCQSRDAARVDVTPCAPERAPSRRTSLVRLRVRHGSLRVRQRSDRNRGATRRIGGSAAEAPRVDLRIGRGRAVRAINPARARGIERIRTARRWRIRGAPRAVPRPVAVAQRQGPGVRSRRVRTRRVLLPRRLRPELHAQGPGAPLHEERDRRVLR